MHLDAGPLERWKVGKVGLFDHLASVLWSTHALKIGIVGDDYFPILAEMTVEFHQIHSETLSVLEGFQGVLWALSRATSVSRKNCTWLVLARVEERLIKLVVAL